MKRDGRMCHGFVVRCAPNRHNTFVTSAEYTFMRLRNLAIHLSICVNCAVQDPILSTAARFIDAQRSKPTGVLWTPSAC